MDRVSLEDVARAHGGMRAVGGGRIAGVPCPVCGGGTRDRFWAHDLGDRLMLGCNACGSGGAFFEAALRALGLMRERSAPRGRRPNAGALGLPGSRPAPPTGGGLEAASSARPGRVWAAGGAVAGTPGAVYLGARLGGGWPGEHVSVRWIGAAEYSGLDVGGWPGLPAGADGALAYLFAAPADCGSAHAVQVEALDGAGRRLVAWRHWDRAAGVELVREAKRETVAGSRFGHGRRVFVGRLAAGPCWLVEGPIDALSVARNLPAGQAGAILGAAGVPGFQAGAVGAIPAGTEIVIAADADPDGRAAAVRLGEALERIGRRPWSIRSPVVGDWCDWFAAAAVDRAEREAIRNE